VITPPPASVRPPPHSTKPSRMPFRRPTRFQSSSRHRPPQRAEHPSLAAEPGSTFVPYFGRLAAGDRPRPLAISSCSACHMFVIPGAENPGFSNPAPPASRPLRGFGGGGGHRRRNRMEDSVKLTNSQLVLLF
jgi:hypothetical protein